MAVVIVRTGAPRVWLLIHMGLFCHFSCMENFLGKVERVCMVKLWQCGVGGLQPLGGQTIYGGFAVGPPLVRLMDVKLMIRALLLVFVVVFVVFVGLYFVGRGGFVALEVLMAGPLSPLTPLCWAMLRGFWLRRGGFMCVPWL